MPAIAHYGREDARTPGLAETRRRYGDAYRRGLAEANGLVAGWLAADRALPGHRLPLARQLAHALASAATLGRKAVHCPKGASTMDRIPVSPDLDDAGAALKALGEEIVLLAYYRGSSPAAEDRFSVRLMLEGTPTGVQESGATASAAFAKAVAARAGRQRSLADEAAIRAEISRRTAGSGC